MRIVIIGGNAAGMSCAARARRNDESAEILVLERGEHVSYASCGLPYYVGGEITEREDLLVQTPRSLSAVLNITVRTGSEVVAIDPAAHTVDARMAAGQETVEYDALVLTPGAKPFIPDIPGIGSSFVSKLRTVPDADRVAELAHNATSAVVLGGGFIGLEAAEALVIRGLKVHVVDLAGHVLPMMEPEIAAPAAAQLRELGVQLHTGVGATRIIERTADGTVDGSAGSTDDSTNDSGIDSNSIPNGSHAVELSNGEVLPADLVLVSIGIRPDTAIFEAAGIRCNRSAIDVDEHGRTSMPGIWAAGDATLSTDFVTGARRPVALAGPANRAGRLIADDICNPETARPIPAALGTSIIRIGELTVARTGAGREDLKRAGIQFHAIHLEAAQHASYFPGAVAMRMLVLFGDDGRLLGAQIVGGEGVDKRIDVFAAAIRSGAAIDDLIDEDLAYSPPFGQAKDPVNLAGMLGENVLSGKLHLWYAQELVDVARTDLILDVRSPAEFATGHVRGALNIPHTEVRARMDEILDAAAGRPIAVMCASGKRSYFAYRILVQHGLSARNLSGGMHVLRDALGDSALADSSLFESPNQAGGERLHSASAHEGKAHA
ncbi:MAG: FAD-dependent oxidoreductase [Bifidobacterium tibiigranuli]|jgi:NADPH-dependent 2,4-dienoyl-CoA reductase/sulfur reductase-like enzyme/rhodanese-related sulfurtransferase|uniref:FAD-dependent oxidoreductase n=1 Tax=Bifidobacterium tibiigranuli TaxID=2172043 RepID=UPI0026F301CF|nr:FAD-dependent oxidoreductase [Bifidobacterium tibiigranuli]MCI1674504.1 FAD-dependent oxidoreductase [Bifidobacterium tibiigranuli]MCI1713069.1 FAD-dependent oxidoreductase [Bifidobacterium tibiigranuli]MCI1834781.1 FAD-dependent oxidoreductase [Bifidobacterium tibiigranuli]